MTHATEQPWVRRTHHVLRPDPSRVVSLIFLPGQEMAASGDSRSSAVLDRILALSDEQVLATLRATTATFGARHRGLDKVWDAHYSLMAHRIEDPAILSAERRRLIGAYFTQEYAVEATALFNPSMLEHPDQTGLADGSRRFLMSARAVGEGHLSSVEWRTGTIDAADSIVFDTAPTAAILPTSRPITYSRTMFEQQLRERGGTRTRTNSTFVLDVLPESFTRQDLDHALARLRDERLTRGAAVRTIGWLEWIADCNYAIEFAADSDLQERVIMPRGPSERRGMEDVRMVRFPHTTGDVDYFGTYTAYDGQGVASQLLHTTDFRIFDVTQLSGPGSRNKGMALFPRQINGRYVALSRADRESNAVTTSVDMHHWNQPTLVQTPHESWEIIQLGNCGPPIETHAGWLVLTHGVGTMREYSMGAILLDLDDPTVVVGRLTRPLLTPSADERSGYVPNVIYSCGAMQHGRTLMVPYGCSDSTIRIALVDLDALLTELGAGTPAPATPR